MTQWEYACRQPCRLPRARSFDSSKLFIINALEFPGRCCVSKGHKVPNFFQEVANSFPSRPTSLPSCLAGFDGRDNTRYDLERKTATLSGSGWQMPVKVVKI